MKYDNRRVLSGLVALLCTGLAAAALGDTPVSRANATVLGPNVYVFDPSMPAADVQRTATDIFKKMEANQFGPERYALLFKPGTYNVTFNVGFYTQVAGLGASPDDVEIDGGVNVNAKWADGASPGQLLAVAGELRRDAVVGRAVPDHQGRDAHRGLPGCPLATPACQGRIAALRLGFERGRGLRQRRFSG